MPSFLSILLQRFIFIVYNQGIEDAFKKWVKHIVDKFGGQNTGLKKSVDGLKEVVDGMKLSTGAKIAEVHKAVGGLKDLAERMEENLSNMEKVGRIIKVF